MTTQAPPLVSVLVPAYNHESYIEACLESVGRDTYPRKELVLLDDGSKDDTLGRARRWLEAHASRFERVLCLHQENRGLCRTANRLVSEARGDYVTFVASDDALLEGGIAARVEALERRPDLWAVFADAELMDGAGQTVGSSAMELLYRTDKRMLRRPRAMRTELLLHWAVPGPVFLARRAVYDPGTGIGPYDEGLAVEDRDFYLRLLAAGRLGFVDRTVARYRIHGQNLSQLPSVRPLMSSQLLRTDAKNLPRFTGFDWLCLKLLILARGSQAGREGAGALAYAARTGSFVLFRGLTVAILKACRAANALAPGRG